MRTSANSSPSFSPTMSNIRYQPFKSKTFSSLKNRNFRKPVQFRSRKVSKPKEQLIKFPSFSLLGGNRQDPLNLNELIQMSRQQQVTNNNDSIDTDIYGNDRPIELLLQPDIFDPLCLDSSSLSQHPNEQINLQRYFHQYYDQQLPRCT
ncbi:hypothetical protein I4U23_024206 [Adineta vaga]|nr:hypothetical protein I4U23_024206 [Adineta vaga]